MLVMVMIVTGVGLLFGAGALLLFRYQCQQRIDRQHELEKVYAVRSALNYIRTKTDIPDAGKTFAYHTASERNLGVLVKPVEAIFPDLTNDAHFAMQRSGDFRIPRPKQYDRARDYEYGVSGVTNGYDVAKCISSEYLVGSALKSYGLAFLDTAAANGARWWVNIGMRGTGGWLQEDYGRRYCFELCDYLGNGESDDNGVCDIVRLCLVRNITNEMNAAGCRYGWPLSQNGEMAIVLEIRPHKSGSEGFRDVTLYEYRYGSVPVLRFQKQVNDALNYMGMQIAERNVTIFSIDKRGGGDPRLRPYTFVEDRGIELSKEAYAYFSREVVIGGKSYGGIYTNSIDGKICAPELRAVVEVEACSNSRNGELKSNCIRLTDFRVTPAYQYDVFVEHPALVTNRATVAQKVITGKYSAFGTGNTVRTYDTHGTEHKGFRRDEREAERRAR